MQKVSSKLKSGLLLAAALATGCVAANAQTPAAAQEKKGWETTAAATLALTRGNSHTALTTGTLDTKRKWEKDEAAFGVAAGYGESSGSRNTEFINGFGQYNRLFNERFYGGIRVDGNYDGIARLDYRFRVSPLLGYYLVKQPKTSLTVEAGPSLVLEKYSDQSSDTYLGARFGEKFEHKLSDTTKIWQSAEYIPQVDRWAKKFTVTTEVGIDTAITKKWSLRVLGQDIYDSEPVAGNKRHDLRILAGTAYKF